MKKLFYFVAMVATAAATLCCNKTEGVNVEQESEQSHSYVMTKGYGDKEPIIIVDVETNDVNPLLALGYTLPVDEGTIPFIDIVNLFAANIHKTTVNGVVQPTLYLNDKLTNVLENGGVSTYIAPLQAQGIKVCLTTLGDWQSLGHGNMTSTQAQQFAYICAAAVAKYGLDGIDCDDEYSGTNSTVSNSYGNIIYYLRQYMGTSKLIEVFKYGHYSQIYSTAGALINYAYPNFYSYNSSSGISGVGTSQWCPFSINLSSPYYYSSWFTNLLAGGYPGIFFFNLQKLNSYSGTSPLDVFQDVSDAVYDGATVGTNSYANEDRTAGSVSGGFTITYAMAQHYFTYGTWQ